MFDVQSVRQHLLALWWGFIRSLAGTALVFVLAGAALAWAGWWYTQGESPYAVLLSVLVVVESLIAGLVVGARRAVLVTLARALERFQLGRGAVRILFGRLGVSPDQPFGERGGVVVQTVERLPLAQAETRLTQAAEGLAGSGQAEGVSGRLQSALAASVQKFTLAHLREEGVREGGIDLVRTREVLETKVDALLANRFRRTANLWVLVALVGLPLAVLLQFYLLLAFRQG